MLQRFRYALWMYDAESIPVTVWYRPRSVAEVVYWRSVLATALDIISDTFPSSRRVLDHILPNG